MSFDFADSTLPGQGLAPLPVGGPSPRRIRGAGTRGESGRLLGYLRTLQQSRQGRRAVILRLSRLDEKHRQVHHRRIVAQAFDTLTRVFDGQLFFLETGDLVLVFRGAKRQQLEPVIAQIRTLFAKDPAAGLDRQRFAAIVELDHDLGTLIAVAEHYCALAEEVAAQGIAGAVSRPRLPLDGRRLGVIEDAIAQADLASLVQRQAICAVAGGGAPRPMLQELYVSIEGLRQMLMLDEDILANAWLFQDLTRHLDRRMISILNRQRAAEDEAEEPKPKSEPISLNFNVQTLLGPDFLDFDEMTRRSGRSPVIVELQMIDVLADLGSFGFARDFLKARGYRICLDGASPMTLPFVDRRRLGVDLVKLRWDRQLLRQPEQLDEVAAHVERLSSDRVILCHCDSPEAVEHGRALGIRLFQGYHVDALIADQDDEAEVA